jgi:hypothetical protein
VKLCGLLLLALPLHAGVIYDFTTHLEAPRSKEEVTGKVWIDGDAFRAEVTRGGAVTIVISKDADRTAVIIDPQKEIWANRSRVRGDVRSAALFLWPTPDAKVSGKPRIEYRRGESLAIANHQATAHIIECAFSVSSDDVRGTYVVTERIWTSDDLPPLPMDRALRTGYASVDRELRKLDANITGMVLRHELEVVRTLEGGPSQVERAITIVNTVAVADITASQFNVPPSYRYAGPVTPGQ